MEHSQLRGEACGRLREEALGGRAGALSTGSARIVRDVNMD